MPTPQSLQSRLAQGRIDLTANWSQRSYQIALRLQERGEWQSYLSSAELPWLTKALSSEDLWERFITPRSEQWRYHSPPSPIFNTAPDSPKDSNAAAHSTLSSEQTNSPPSAPNKRQVPQDYDDDGDDRMDGRGKGDAQVGKRARASANAPTDEDDDMLSVISGSDIEMAMWTGDAFVASNAVSPGSLSDTAAAAKPQGTGSIEGDLAASESSIICAMAAFHARSAIFEQYVSALCDTANCTRCSDTVNARKDVESVEEQLSADNKNHLGQATDGDGDAANDGDSMVVQVPSLVEAKAPEPLVSRSLDEDEDYDDYDDGDDEGEANNNAKGPSKPPAEAILNDASADGSKKMDVDTKSAVSIPEMLSASIPNATGAADADAQKSDIGPEGQKVVRVALHRVFHTLDELSEVVHEQEVRELHVQQIKDVVEQRAAEPKDMLVNKIGSLQNMKNLAQFIDNHRDSVNMSTRELSHLLSEVRPKRTKWANDRRIGQVELYEALEHVLHELKTMGEASIPFLNQVKRKDAPDYYKVIKNPMDLSAMAKNLRNEVYNNKKQFADHLQLIRDNCYTYNTEPGNYYRKSADSLLAKARILMENVPDIVIREKGAAGTSAHGGDDAHTDCGDESGNESQSVKTGTYGNHEGSVYPDDGTPAPLSAVDSSASGLLARASIEDTSSFPTDATTNDGSAVQTIQQQQQQLQHPANLSVLAHNILRATSTDSAMRTAISDIVDGHDRSLGEKIWSSKVRKQLAEYYQRIEHDAQSEFPDRHVPVRLAEKMQSFLQASHDAVEVIDEKEVDAIAKQNVDIARLRTVFSQTASNGDVTEVRRRNEALDAERKEWLSTVEDMDGRGWTFVSESEPAAGLPQLESLESQAAKEGVLQWLNDDCETTVEEVLQSGPQQVTKDTGVNGNAEDKGTLEKRPSIEAYAVARFPDNAMWRDMAENVELLRSIREIDSKIWAAKLNAPIGHGGFEPLYRSEGRGHSQDDLDEQGHSAITELHRNYANTLDPPTPFSMDSNGARKLLQRTTALILAHTGFNAVTESAMSGLMDFFVDYMTNVGRTLRTYMDKHGRTMSMEAILAHTLYDNGTEDLAELEYYARGEIIKQGHKLMDLKKNLSRSYQEIMSDGRPDGAGASVDASTLESGDSFITGMVGGLGDLGDDFFGFKELGLDKEFGLETLNVPQRLWYGKSAAQNDTGVAQQQEVLAFPLPKPWEPIITPRGQIGLLQKFLCEKLKAVNGIDPPGFKGVLDGASEGNGDEDNDINMEDSTIVKSELQSEPRSEAKGNESEKADERKPAIANNEDNVADVFPEDWKPIPEDESLPVRMRYGASRPKQPQPNYLTHPRTHMHVGSGQVATPTAHCKEETNYD
ncbi:Transcriptional activator spt7 [Coemansia sp. Benny D115]|nr:Transcriptional activator spt7 [Coemansia sp. Benny D115]